MLHKSQFEMFQMLERKKDPSFPQRKKVRTAGPFSVNVSGLKYLHYNGMFNG